MKRVKMRYAQHKEERVYTWRYYAWLCQFSRHKGMTVIAKTASTDRSHPVLSALKADREERMKREESLATYGVRTTPSAPPGLLAKSSPLLAVFLTDTSWDDGQERAEAWIQIRPRMGKWTIELYDPNFARSARFTADTYSELLPLLEAALESQKVPWMHQDWMVKFIPKTRPGKTVDRKKRTG